MRASAKLADWLKLFARNNGGALALNFALVILPLSMLTCGAVDFASVLSDKQRMQQVADSAALDAAAQLVLASTTGVPDRANAFALSQLQRISDRVALTADTVISQKGDSVTVTIDGHRGSFFANLLPPGGFHLRASATAMSMGKTPLCVLNTGADADATITMADSSNVTAPGCLVHSDSDVTVSNSAWLQADAVQSVGAATGRITPDPLVGAAHIADPFASLDMTPPSGLLSCVLIPDLLTNLLTIDVQKGKHCSAIVVGKNKVLHLEPGEHYFVNSNLILQEGATIEGTDVVLIFDRHSYLRFKDNAQVKLEGRKSGKFAGFVIATTKENTNAFEISSDHAHKLLGTIYIPNTTLDISGTSTRVADQSAWTVIVAKSIAMSGSPNLVINNNYAAATIPVPDGVGPNRGVALVH